MVAQTGWRMLAAPVYGIYAGVFPDRTGSFQPGTAFHFQPGDRARLRALDEHWNTITKGATLPEDTVTIEVPFDKGAEWTHHIGTFYVAASALRFEDDRCAACGRERRDRNHLPEFRTVSHPFSEPLGIPGQYELSFPRAGLFTEEGE
jgi:hypothetical protein